MRHRKRGRRLGRSSPHKHSMLRNMAASLILTEREVGEFDVNPPKVKGRIITTISKAKEVRSHIEKCITLARKALAHTRAADDLATTAERNSAEWKSWRKSPRYREWNTAIAPAVAARRRLIQMLGDKSAVSLLMSDLAERFEDRPGGYTRILRLAKPRLGDAGTRVVLEFVGKNDRSKKKTAPKPVVE